MFVSIFAFQSRFHFSASGQAVVTGRCRPFSPPGTSLNFYCAEGSAFTTLVDFRRILLTSALVLSTSQFLHQKRSLRVVRVCYRSTRGAETSEIDLTSSGYEISPLARRGSIRISSAMIYACTTVGFVCVFSLRYYSTPE